MKKMTGICFVIVMCMLSVNVQANPMEGFIDMEDLAAFAADWREPLQMADLEFFTERWLTNYMPVPSLAWWEMEEVTGLTLYDSTDNANDLVSTAGFAISNSTVGSIVGSGMRFDGSGEKLTHPTLLDDFPDAITITGWVKPDATGMDDTQCWFSKQNVNGFGEQIWLIFKMGGTTPNVIAASGRSNATFFNCNTTITWEDDTWYHYAYTWDSSGMNLYINGTLAKNVSLPIMGDGTYIDLSIGTNGFTNPDLSMPFKGIIDDVKIYSSVLSGAEVKAIYDSAPGVITYDLDVSSGTGDGKYYEGLVVNIAADPSPAGYMFDVWTGDTAYITDMYDSTTKVTMPNSAVAVTATYKAIYLLKVSNGTADDDYCYQGQVIYIAADRSPAGYRFDMWVGDTSHVTNRYVSTTTIIMPGYAIDVTATYEPIGATYALTVNDGDGDGNYPEHAEVDIYADTPPAGQVFDDWSGDITYVKDIYNSTTTVTMPAFAVSVTATYKTAPISLDQTVLLEAEGFDDHGGWSLDQQYMDQMGSPYLLAHGINNPVADATTFVTFPSTGIYHVWVRTRDWTGIWKEPYLNSSSVKYANGAPGQFQVVVNGTTLATTFGTENRQWHWQDGGTISINSTNVNVVLHDLTGYEGRCDAIVFSKDYTTSPPPNMEPDMKLWRRDMLGNSGAPEFSGQYDLVVVGGGVAGTCAAISAARHGVSVALIQDRPILGGNNSSEVRVQISGEGNNEPYSKIGNIVLEIDTELTGNRMPASYYDDDRKLAVVQAEPNIDLYLNYRVNEVIMNGNKIASVIAENTMTGHRLQFDGKLFADCTGDAVLGYIAGADWEMTVSGLGEGTKMGTSNLWRFEYYGGTQTFPSVPWALNLASGNFKTSGLGDWFWESGFYYDSIADGEYIRDWNFRAAYGTWDALKNKMVGYNGYLPEWQAFISGKRESRRMMGDIILTREDLLLGNKLDDPLTPPVFEDGCFPVNWRLDLHYPNGMYGVNKGFGGDEFISFWDGPVLEERPVWAPYRCLYSRNIDNLFMAGRHISVTHGALGAVRVQMTTGMMGEVVGLAASLCNDHNITPRGVYQYRLGALKALLLNPDVE